MSMAVIDVQNAERERWIQRLEEFLERACAAEAQDDFEAARAMFREALYCDAKLRPQVTNPKAYVDAAGPVYDHKQIKSVQDNSGELPCVSL